MRDFINNLDKEINLIKKGNDIESAKAIKDLKEFMEYLDVYINRTETKLYESIEREEKAQAYIESIL